MELYGSYSRDHTRFTRDFDDGTGHLGKYITDAPLATGAFEHAWSEGEHMARSELISYAVAAG